MINIFKNTVEKRKKPGSGRTKEEAKEAHKAFIKFLKDELARSPLKEKTRTLLVPKGYNFIATKRVNPKLFEKRFKFGTLRQERFLPPESLEQVVVDSFFEANGSTYYGVYSGSGLLSRIVWGMYCAEVDAKELVPVSPEKK